MHHIQSDAPLRGAYVKHADDLRDRPIVNMQLERPEVIAAPVSRTISLTRTLNLMLMSNNTVTTSGLCPGCRSDHLHLFLSMQPVSKECLHM